MNGSETEWQDVRAVEALMDGFGHPWFVAGGWAIDLYLGEQTRPHGDVEIAVFRESQQTFQSYLEEWSFEKIVDGEPKPWTQGEYLRLPVHELHGENPESDARPPTLEVLLNERRGDEWVFRRSPDVTRAVSEFGMVSDDGVPFLSPEVVLLYKLPIYGEHDQRDFENCLPALEAKRRRWLRQAIRRVNPTHSWADAL